MRNVFYSLFIAVALTVSAGLASAQSYRATGMYYSYTPQLIGEQQVYVLMPIPTDQIRPNAPLQSILPTAFGLLKSGKEATYGNSSLRISDEDLAARRAIVHVDPTAAPYLAIIAAETIYTMSHYGIERVVFPGLADEGLTRADVAFAAFRFQLPMWQALPPAQVYYTDIVLPDASLLASDEFYERLARNDRELAAMILDYLESEHTYEVAGALAALSRMEVEGAELAVLALLDSQEGELRTNALEFVVRSDEPAVWERLVEALVDDSDADLARIIELVAEAPIEELQIQALYHRAEFGEPSSRVAALTELAELDDSRALERLLAYLLADPAEFALASFDALVHRGSWPEIAALLEQEELREAVRMQAATALIGHEDPIFKLQGLRYRVLDQRGGSAVATADQIAEVEDAAAVALLNELLTHADAGVRARAAWWLAELGELGAMGAIAAAAQADDLEDEQAAVLKDAVLRMLLAQGPAAVTTAARANDDWMRRLAYDAMGILLAGGDAPEDVLPMIEAGTSAAELDIQVASTRALSHVDTEAAFERLLELLEDDAPSVRAAAAAGLGNYKQEAQVEASAPILAELAQGAEPEVQAGALVSVGALGMTGLMPLVLDRIDSPEAAVRASAMRAAQQLSDERNSRAVLNAVAGRLRDPHQPNRAVAASVLGEFRTDQAVLTLSQVINDQDVNLRLATIAALGRSAQRSAIGLLVALLEEPNPDINIAALEALRELGLSAAIPDLEAVMPRIRDEQAREMTQELITWLGTEGS